MGEAIWNLTPQLQKRSVKAVKQLLEQSETQALQANLFPEVMTGVEI